jgi:hypothetical protein
MHAIYVYKPPETENTASSWIYYRVGSVDADEPRGKLYAPIQVCQVSWPALKDIPPMIDTPGITRLASAYSQVQKLLREQMGVDHESSVLIGLLSPEIVEDSMRPRRRASRARGKTR